MQQKQITSDSGTLKPLSESVCCLKGKETAFSRSGSWLPGSLTLTLGGDLINPKLAASGRAPLAPEGNSDTPAVKWTWLALSLMKMRVIFVSARNPWEALISRFVRVSCRLEGPSRIGVDCKWLWKFPQFHFLVF